MTQATAGPSTARPSRAQLGKVYVAWVRAGSTPAEQVKRAAKAQADLAELQTRLARERNRLVARLVNEEHLSHARAAELLGVSKTRVAQLLASGHDT